MEGKTNFSRCLKQFDGLTWLTDPDPHILRQIYATVEHWTFQSVAVVENQENL